jgi:hypothetical protein
MKIFRWPLLIIAIFAGNTLAAQPHSGEKNSGPVLKK